jgi:hypothetical protein
MAAVEGGHVCMLDYMQAFEPAASAAQMTHMLNVAGGRDHLCAAQWLWQQGAEWPAVLTYGFAAWRTDVLQWARYEGCTAPTG